MIIVVIDSLPLFTTISIVISIKIRLGYLIGANMERTGLKRQIQAFPTGRTPVLKHITSI